MGAGAREDLKTCPDLRAGEAASALRWREIIPKQLLHSADGDAEIRHVTFRQRRQDLHQNKTTNVRSVHGTKGRQMRKRSALLFAMHAASFAIENQHNTPFIRERHSADDWGCARRVLTSTVNYNSA